MTDILAESEAYVDADPASQLEARQRIEQFDAVLKEVPPRAYVTFVLHRRYGYSLEEIGSGRAAGRVTPLPVSRIAIDVGVALFTGGAKVGVAAPIAYARP
jgi:hypothetical protein